VKTSGPLILIASDHAGFELKSNLVQTNKNISFVDLGPADSARVDYPDFAQKLVDEWRQTKAPKFGVLICGSGQGMAIKANRSPQVRAALCWTPEIAKLAREHNDANILCLPGRFLSVAEATQILQIFIATKFAGGRHQQRVEKLK
jgi:ribose 5-phosphate isomerase B